MISAYTGAHPVSELSFDHPAIYRIHVRGRLIERWCDQLLGLHVRSIRRIDEAEVTVLEGEVADQAALVGVLVALYDMQLPVLGVQYLGARGGHP